MKFCWQDVIIIGVLLVMICLPCYVNNQEYGEGLDGRKSFLGELEGKRLFYPVIKGDYIPWEVDADAYYSVLLGSGQGEKSKVLVSKIIDAKIPMASITKLMTAVIALDNYPLDDELIIDQRDMVMSSGSLASGQKYSFQDLLHIMLIESNNGAAEAIARKMGRSSFIEKMNLKARSLGMLKTEYLNPSGLDIDELKVTNTTSAEDLVRLTSEIIEKYPLIGEILSLREDVVREKGGYEYKMSNTNLMLSDDERILWGKTGFTLMAKGCLLLVTTPSDFSFSSKRYIITIVLGADDRFESMRRIISWQNNQFIW